MQPDTPRTSRPRRLPPPRPARWALALAGALVLGTSPPAGADAATPAPPDLTTVLQRFQAAQDALTTFQPRFAQEKKLPMLKDRLRSSGQLYFHLPDRLLWRFEEPEPSLILIKNGELLNWRIAQKKAAVVKDVEKKQRRLFEYFGIGGNVMKYQKRFTCTLTVEDAPAPEAAPRFHLTLIPKSRRVAKHLARVEIWLDGDHYLPARVEYHNPDGGYTKFAFSTIQLNQGIDPETFEVSLPDDITIDHSLDKVPLDAPAGEHASLGG